MYSNEYINKYSLSTCSIAIPDLCLHHIFSILQFGADVAMIVFLIYYSYTTSLFHKVIASSGAMKYDMA